MRIVFISIFILIAAASWSQANLGILSQTGEMFLLSLDDEILTEKPDSSFKVFNISPGSHKLAVKLFDNTVLDRSIYLQDETEHWFEVKVDSSKSSIQFYNTFPTSQSDTITLGRTIINLWALASKQPSAVALSNGESSNASLTGTELASIASPGVEMDTSLLDSVALDSIAKLDFSQRYQGERGCPSPVKDFETKLKRLRFEEFDSRRLMKAKSSLPGHCLTVEQITQALNLFEFEDHKLELLGSLRSNIFDLDNIKKLESQFTLSRNQQSFNSLFKINEQ